jgi:hypothetical protein
MALTFSRLDIISLGNRRAALIEASGTNEAGGTAITPASFGLGVIDAIIPEFSGADLHLVYAKAAGKLTLYAASAEDTSTDVTPSATVSVRALVVGK